MSRLRFFLGVFLAGGVCKKCARARACTLTHTRPHTHTHHNTNSGLPQISDFIRKRAPAYGDALRVRYRTGAPPRLLLSKPVGGSSGGGETLRIDNWRADVIDEYLRAHLVLAGEEEHKGGGKKGGEKGGAAAAS